MIFLKWPSSQGCQGCARVTLASIYKAPTVIRSPETCCLHSPNKSVINTKNKCLDISQPVLKALYCSPAVDVHVSPHGIHWLFTNSTIKKRTKLIWVIQNSYKKVSTMLVDQNMSFFCQIVTSSNVTSYTIFSCVEDLIISALVSDITIDRWWRISWDWNDARSKLVG